MACRSWSCRSVLGIGERDGQLVTEDVLVFSYLAGCGWDSATRTEWVERMVAVTTLVTGSTISVTISLPPRVRSSSLVARLVTVEMTSSVSVTREVCRVGGEVWRMGRLRGGGEAGTTLAALCRVGARGKKGVEVVAL